MLQNEGRSLRLHGGMARLEFCFSILSTIAYQMHCCGLLILRSSIHIVVFKGSVASYREASSADAISSSGKQNSVPQG